MHILSPETDNCPSWISGRARMTLENIHILAMHLIFSMPIPTCITKLSLLNAVNTIYIETEGLRKQCRTRSDAVKRGFWSASTLFATLPGIFNQGTLPGNRMDSSKCRDLPAKCERRPHAYCNCCSYFVTIWKRYHGINSHLCVQNGFISRMAMHACKPFLTS